MKIIKQSQKHLDTQGMGILDVPGEIEKAGGKLWLSVQAEGVGNSPSNWYSEFTVDEWNEFKKSLNNRGMTITDVWIDESIKRSSNMKKTIKSSRKPIKSSYEDAFTVYPWSNDCWKYSDHDLGLSYVIESYGEEFLNLDKDTLENEKENLIRYFDDDAFVRDYNIMNPDEQIESIHDIEEPEDLSLEELARYFDYESFGRDIRLEYNMVWDNKRNCWFSARDIDEFENEDDITFLGNSHKNPLKSSSIRYYIRYKDGTTKDIPRDELPEDGIDEYKYDDKVIRIEDSTGKVIKSSKKITSANNYGWEVDSSDAHKALGMWIEQVGEDSALEDVAKALSTDDLDENIEWVAQQWGFGEELDEIEDAWDKYEYAKDIMGAEELLTNLTQAIGYDELAECMAFIFRMNDFREWDSVTSSRKPVKSALSEKYKNKIKWDELEREVERLKDEGYDLEEAADYIFEENDIDQLNELGFIGDSFRVKYDILDAVKEVWGDEIESSKKPVKSSYLYTVEINMKDGNVYQEDYEAESDKWSEAKKEIRADVESDFPEMKNFTMIEKNIITSRKPVKSARFIVEDESGVVIGEADTYEEAKTLNGIIIDTQKDSIQSRRKPVKSSRIQEKPIDYFEAKNVWKSLGLQSYDASSCTVLYDDLKDDLNEINHEVHYNTTMTGYKLEDPDTKVQWAGNTYEELKSDLLDWMNQYGIEAVTSSRKPVKSSFEDDETIDVETIKEEFANDGDGVFSSRFVKSVRDSKTGKEDYSTREEYIDELCDRAIREMDGDKNAMFFRLTENGFDIKGLYIDKIATEMNLTNGDAIWYNVCNNLAMNKLYDITDAGSYRMYQLEVEWKDEGITSSRKPVKSRYQSTPEGKLFDVDDYLKKMAAHDSERGVSIDNFFEFKALAKDDGYFVGKDDYQKYLDYYNGQKGVTSSKKISNGNFPREITKAVLSNRMTQEEAITQICSRNKCNRGFAKNILSRWINEKYETLLKSDAEIADIQKEFDVDGDLESWAEDYMPGSGKANTKGGELVRAAMRIIAEYQNNANMIGRGYGNESVNPAARYIVEKTSFSGNGEIEDMLNHVVQMTDSEYQSWLKRFQSDFENYLRDNSGLFSEPNDDDIADYIEDTDFEFFLREFYAEDSEGNQYHFKLDSGDPDSQFKCTDITFATEPLYEEGDEIEEGDELSNEIDKNEEYSEIEKDGITYTIEAVGGEGENGFNKWKVTDVTIADQVYKIGDVIDVSELDESVTYFDSNGNTLTQDDFNRL